MDFNPLNINDRRRVVNLPPHFQTVYFHLYCDQKQITDWVFENLSGRFFAGNRIVLNDGKNAMMYCVAFENHSEASYFSLILTELNKKYSYA